MRYTCVTKKIYNEGKERAGNCMGKVRPAYIKRTARKLIETYPEAFTTDFEHNKAVLKEMGLFESKRVRNRVAGYIVRLLKRKEKEKME